MLPCVCTVLVADERCGKVAKSWKCNAKKGCKWDALAVTCLAEVEGWQQPRACSYRMPHASVGNYQPAALRSLKRWQRLCRSDLCTNVSVMQSPYFRLLFLERTCSLTFSVCVCATCANRVTCFLCMRVRACLCLACARAFFGLTLATDSIRSCYSSSDDTLPDCVPNKSHTPSDCVPYHKAA